MFIELFLAISAGCILGTFTGLIPGVHVNLVAVLLLTVLTIIDGNPFVLATIAVSMAITHTIVDVIPAIIIGVPDPSLSLLPQHKLVHQGKGYDAVKYTIIGSIGGLLFSILLLPVFLALFNFYGIIKSVIPYILMFVLIITIATDTKKWHAILITFLAGSLGTIILSSSFKEPLFILFTGLFGTSSVIISIINKEKIPPQKISKKIVLTKKEVVSISLSTILASLFTIIPGTGAAHAAFFVQQVQQSFSKNTYLVAIGSINTVNAIVAIIFLYTNERVRTGITATIQSLFTLSFNHLIFFVIATLISASSAVIITLSLGKFFLKKTALVNTVMIRWGILLFLILLSFFLTNFFGLLALFLCTCCGILTTLFRCRRSHLMACIIVPLLLHHL